MNKQMVNFYVSYVENNDHKVKMFKSKKSCEKFYLNYDHDENNWIDIVFEGELLHVSDESAENMIEGFFEGATKC